MTPRKAARIRKETWQAAVIEGRVVKINSGETFKAYPTVSQAKKALADYLASGIPAEIIGN